MEKVSIVVCTYNGEKYIGSQLDSILRQTYPIYEIIIQDDNSQDDTWKILQTYASKHSNIRIYRNERNLGVNGNFFSAIRKTKGDFIAISDQDDLWHEDKIEKQINKIANKLLCSCLSRPFSNDGAYFHYDARIPNYRLIRLIFDGLPGHSMLFKKELFTDIMPKDNELYHVSFYDVALELAAGAFDSIAFVDEVLVEFRRHTDATTYSARKHNSAGLFNAFYMVGWCLLYWRSVRPEAKRFWHARLAFLKTIHSDRPLYFTTVKMLELELQDGLMAKLKLQRLFFNNYKILFHTVGGGPTKKLRALLFPLLQYYHYR